MHPIFFMETYCEIISNPQVSMRFHLTNVTQFQQKATDIKQYARIELTIKY